MQLNQKKSVQPALKGTGERSDSAQTGRFLHPNPDLFLSLPLWPSPSTSLLPALLARALTAATQERRRILIRDPDSGESREQAAAVVSPSTFCAPLPVLGLSRPPQHLIPFFTRSTADLQQGHWVRERRRQADRGSPWQQEHPRHN
jgi:hypothetical protein